MNDIITEEKKTSVTLRGTPASPGYAVGIIHYLQDETHRKEPPAYLGIGEEWERFLNAQRLVIGELAALRDHARERLGESESEIFEIHAMLASDEDLTDGIRDGIDRGMRAEDATKEASEHFRQALAAIEDSYLRARTEDIKDVTERILDALSGVKRAAPEVREGHYLLAAEDLTPAQTLLLDKSRILGILTRRGTRHSHAAILARAMGIPAVVGISALLADCDGREAFLDASAGELILSPDPGEREKFEALCRSQAQNQGTDDDTDEELRVPAVTRSGKHILVYANIGEEQEIDAALHAGADGIGLWRSEMLYLTSAKPPDEETLYQSYRNAAVKLGERRLVIRTLDVGGDKSPSYLPIPQEENPALGLRGIRVSLASTELFCTQLRAILRAGAEGNVALMLPMVVSVEEVRQAKALLEECRRALRQEGIAHAPRTEFGVMIETPAAAVMAHELAREVDFFSVGTNDLTQYTLAADRQNEAVEALCNENREPVMRLIAHAAREMHAAGGWIGICGELAAEPELTARFAEMGIDELSVSVPYLASVRRCIVRCD